MFARGSICAAVAVGALLVLGPPASAPAAAEPIHEAYTGSRVRVQELYQERDDYGYQTAADSARVEKGPTGGPPDAFAEGRNRSEVYGEVGSFARIGSTLQGATREQGSIDARSNSAYLVSFRVESGTLAAGSPAPVRFTARFDGTLDLRNRTGGPIGHSDFYTYAYTGIQLIRPDNTSAYLYEGDGTLSHTGFDGLYEWEAGAFQVTSDSPGHWRATLDTSKTVTFDALVGEQYDLLFDLATGAYASAAYNVEATADFYNTGAAALSPAGAGYQVVIVPEPGSALAAASAVGLLLRRRRR